MAPPDDPTAPPSLEVRRRQARAGERWSVHYRLGDREFFALFLVWTLAAGLYWLLFEALSLHAGTLVMGVFVLLLFVAMAAPSFAFYLLVERRRQREGEALTEHQQRRGR